MLHRLLTATLLTAPLLAGADSAVPALADRVTAFVPPSHHRVIEQQQTAERLRLVTLPDGGSAEQWRSRFLLQREPATSDDSWQVTDTLFEHVEAPYLDCDPAYQVYKLDSLSTLVDDEHVARTLTVGCGRQSTADGEQLEVSIARAVAGPQGAFLVQWSERWPVDSPFTQTDFDRLRNALDRLDPIYGQAVRAAQRAEFDAALQQWLTP